MADPDPAPPSPELQFDVAEPASGSAPAAQTCAFCSRPIEREYYTIAARSCCGACRELALREQGGPARPGRFLKALLFGAGAAALGCALYYAVLALTGYEIGLVAIVVGYLVGAAVRRGSGGRGGWPYQTLALTLTYLAIVFTYVPFIVQAIRTMPPPGTSETPAAAPSDGLGAPTPPPVGAKPADAPPTPPSFGDVAFALALLVVLACAAPFLAGAGNLLGLLIIGFALFEAWKLNRKVKLDFAGPFQTAPDGTAGA
jgi:hypothetical protein